MFLQVADEEFYSQQGHDKGHDGADEQNVEAVCIQYFRRFGIDVVNAFERCRHHGGDGQEERKFRGQGAAQVLLHTSDDGGGTSAEAGEDDGQDLVAANQEGLFRADFLLCMGGWLKEPFINEQEDHSSQQHHQRDDPGFFEYRFDMGFEQGTEYKGREYGDEEFQVKREISQTDESFPVKNHHRKDGAELNDDLEKFGEWICVDAHESGGDGHMTGGRDRQKFGKPLDDGDEDGLERIHVERHKKSDEGIAFKNLSGGITGIRLFS